MKLMTMALALLAIPGLRSARGGKTSHGHGGRDWFPLRGAGGGRGREAETPGSGVPDVDATDLCWEESSGHFCLSLVEEAGRTIARLARTIGPYVAFCDSAPLGTGEKGEAIRIAGPRLYSLSGDEVVPIRIERKGGAKLALLTIDPSMCELEAECLGDWPAVSH